MMFTLSYVDLVDGFLRLWGYLSLEVINNCSYPRLIFWWTSYTLLTFFLWIFNLQPAQNFDGGDYYQQESIPEVQPEEVPTETFTESEVIEDDGTEFKEYDGSDIKVDEPAEEAEQAKPEPEIEEPQGKISYSFVKIWHRCDIYSVP